MNQLYNSSPGLPSVIRNWLLEECELIDRRKTLRHKKREKPQKRFEFPRLSTVNWLMSEHAFFEYRAKLITTPHNEEQAEPIHCLIKMEIGAGCRRPPELLEQEAENLVLFALNSGPYRRISQSTICEVDEERLRKLGPGPDFYISKTAEINFYVS